MCDIMDPAPKVRLAYLNVCFAWFIVSTVQGQARINDARAIEDFLKNYHNQASKLYYNYKENSWNYQFDPTSQNKNLMDASKETWDKFLAEGTINASRYDTSVMSERDQRIFKLLLDIDFAAQKNEVKLKRINELKEKMKSESSKAKTGDMKSSRDYLGLLQVWKDYRDAIGTKLKPLYPEFVELGNEAIRILGYDDMGAYMRSHYVSDKPVDEMYTLYEGIRPLYEQLHAYVRGKLKRLYGEDKFPASGHIPAHILGDQLAINWNYLENEFIPYPSLTTLDLTDEMVKQNYTVLKMIQTADQFYQSLDLKPMPKEFWEKSVFEKPTDVPQFNCRNTYWGFRNGKDVRMQMCATVKFSDLLTAYKLMAFIQYTLQFADQPFVLQEDPNPSFEMALGEAMLLSVNSPHYLQSIGLLKEVIDNKELELNSLMTMALKIISFLPFGYLAEKWRYQVFRGETTQDKYNKEWWNLRCQYQGIYPPAKRSSDDFDPGAASWISSHTSYLKVFVGYILQFQFYKALCDISGYEGPLHRCDISKSNAIGKKLSKMLKLGTSKPWPETLEILTGKKAYDTQPLMDYFKPLMEFLKKEIGQEKVGWETNCPLNNN
ncbi:angiotensin-converting enzyme-like [Biomphalaria glabrata]|uniref:Angiotensin-converting enzyme n=1 Tax=Biomphalaria glabrata TaxID=6526 RepID=A0A9W2YE93_BIOGL|nr:angiotensin-converting enzyme-like [Biomphalaria glabrata]XP_055861054.1 angiotensin-converting enzyme-like [Biomphalaria glabrata]